MTTFTVEFTKTEIEFLENFFGYSHDSDITRVLDNIDKTTCGNIGTKLKEYWDTDRSRFYKLFNRTYVKQLDYQHVRLTKEDWTLAVCNGETLQSFDDYVRTQSPNKINTQFGDIFINN